MKKLALATIFSLFSFQALADNSAGCGLGSLIWRDNSIVSATMRMTTNASFSSQLFGITSGTSGCANHSIVMREKAPIYYAEANMEELKVDMAKGQGEYVSIFSDALGCPESLKQEFVNVSKENYSSIFSKSEVTPEELISNVKQVIKNAPALSGRCSYATL